jgi:hypothetical protein
MRSITTIAACSDVPGVTQITAWLITSATVHGGRLNARIWPIHHPRPSLRPPGHARPRHGEAGQGLRGPPIKDLWP